jgi:hypothetical protein
VSDAAAARVERLAGALDEAGVGRRGWMDGRRLAVLGGALVPVGIGLVLLGWHGASRTSNVYEQVPYLISGAQLGQTLAVVGALCFFAHWLTVLVREHRQQTREVVGALERLEAAITAALDGSGRVATGAPAAGAPERLVATARGTLAHRPGCSVVAGRTGLREVALADGLARCQLCRDA